MLVIAAIGLICNLIVIFVLGGHGHHREAHDHEHEREDLNVRSAFLHVVGDAVSSVGVILAAGIIWTTGWQWVDPLVSVLIGVLILISSWRVLRGSLHILVEGVPEGLSLAKISQSMAEAPGVQDVHDLHVWNLCSGHIALSAHVVVSDQSLGQAQTLLDDLISHLKAGFGIEHTTIQFECASCGHGRMVCGNGNHS